MKRVRLLLLLMVAALVLAPVASACERCVIRPMGVTCWSAFTTGWQWCYGGFGEPCVTGDKCPSDALLTAPAEEEVAAEACAGGALGCAQPAQATDEAPEGGLTLEN